MTLENKHLQKIVLNYIEYKLPFHTEHRIKTQDILRVLSYMTFYYNFHIDTRYNEIYDFRNSPYLGNPNYYPPSQITNSNSKGIWYLCFSN